MTPIIRVMWVVVILSIFGTSAALVPHPGCPLFSKCGKESITCPDTSWDSGYNSETSMNFCLKEGYTDETTCVDSIKSDLAEPNDDDFQYTWCGVAEEGGSKVVYRGLYKCECEATDVETLSLEFLRTSIQQGLIHYASIYPGKPASNRMRRSVDYTCPSGQTNCKLTFDQELKESTTSKLSGGAIAGIVLGAAAFLIIVVLLVRRGKKQGLEGETFL